jgi:hypothetical protein
MDIKELDKKQLILLTLLITFVVSIATGIVTVSLMNQMPKSVPQTINNVIQRTIEKVTTVEVPSKPVTDTNDKEDKKSSLVLSGGDALVSIYLNNSTETNSTTDAPADSTTNENGEAVIADPNFVGQGVIISDIGLILVDSSIITETNSYKVILNKTDFNASVLKKFGNGFTILKISPIEKKTETTDTSKNPQ